VQLDDKVTPLIDTPKVTALQMLICVGAGDSPSPLPLQPLLSPAL